jgi:hypothetical protein
MNYSHKTIEDLLWNFKSIIGIDFDKYRNHVYRVFLNSLLIDPESSNEEKYAIVAVFHDLGIWTNHTIDYLEPSIKLAKEYLITINKSDWVEEISMMIYWHHKPSRYQGNHQTNVETFRKADWIDVSLGVKTFGVDKRRIAAIRKNFPNLGFHIFLVKKILRNFVRHPLRPLPMFKN